MATPHISAEPGDFAPAVLMPGDPKRAERMAETILDDARLVTQVRGISGFTGTYNGAGEHHGKPLSVMASGMGMPSIGIYSTELYKFFGVERIIRVGTCGGVSPKVDVGDVIIGFGAHTASGMNEVRIPGVHFSAVADLPMAAAAWQAAKGSPHVFAGSVVSEDHFYFQVPGMFDGMVAHGVLAVEMEAASLYAIAAEFGKAALAIFTVSDHLTKHGSDMSSEDRESRFTDALGLAVAAAFV